jgi:hypothetical protein
MAEPVGASRLRLRVLPTVLFTAAILLLPGLLYAWGRQSDAFAVERVSVQGGWRISEQRAARLLRKEFVGRNLFTVTTSDVRAALHPLDYLAGVAIDRDFPTTLRVRLVEYRPAAYVYAAGRWFMLADGGHVIGEVGKPAKAPTSGSGAALDASPTPSTVTPAEGDVSATASADDEATDAQAAEQAAAEAAAEAAARSAALAAALRSGPAGMKPRLPRMAADDVPAPGARIADDGVLAGLRVLAGLPAKLRGRVEVVRVLSGGQVTLQLDGGLFVDFGGEDRLVAKGLALRAVLAAYRGDGTSPTYIDVSAPDRPLGRPRLSS